MHTDEPKDETKRQPAEFSRGCFVAILVAFLALGGLVAGYMYMMEELGEGIAELDQAPPPDHWDEGSSEVRFADPDAGGEDIVDAD